MIDSQATNPYESPAELVAGDERPRKFPWKSTAFHLLSVCLLLGTILGIGFITGRGSPIAVRVFLLWLKLSSVPFVSACVIAGVFRVIFFRTTFRPWFYYFLMILNILVGCFLLLATVVGAINKLGVGIS